VIAFLNGIIVHGSLSLKNLIVKFTANVLAVSSGLPAAIQAPIITYGSAIFCRVPYTVFSKRPLQEISLWLLERFADFSNSWHTIY